MTKDRFDLEQEIMRCWNVVEDIKLLNTFVLENTPDGAQLTTDEISNYLLGLESIYELKFQQLWKTFSQTLQTNQL
jgi:glycosylphosphatidylinositol transamidase (GPIT) subunit GPI8